MFAYEDWFFLRGADDKDRLNSIMKYTKKFFAVIIVSSFRKLIIFAELNISHPPLGVRGFRSPMVLLRND